MPMLAVARSTIVAEVTLAGATSGMVARVVATLNELCYRFFFLMSLLCGIILTTLLCTCSLSPRCTQGLGPGLIALEFLGGNS